MARTSFVFGCSHGDDDDGVDNDVDDDDDGDDDVDDDDDVDNDVDDDDDDDDEDAGLRLNCCFPFGNQMYNRAMPRFMSVPGVNGVPARSFLGPLFQGSPLWSVLGQTPPANTLSDQV